MLKEEFVQDLNNQYGTSFVAEESPSQVIGWNNGIAFTIDGFNTKGMKQPMVDYLWGGIVRSADVIIEGTLISRKF